MKLLPAEEFYIITPFKPEEVQMLLEIKVKPLTEFSFKNIRLRANKDGLKDYDFVGYSFEGQFEIKPVINYRNSFLPVIKGNTQPYVNGSLIHVKMAMDSGVAVFLYMWLGGVAAAFISILVDAVKDISLAGWLLLPLGMGMFAYGMAYAGFKAESRSSGEKLLKMFKGELSKK